MSYILDALRRADSERERERSKPPGLNSQMSAPAVQAEDLTQPSPVEIVGSRPWPKLLVGLGLGLALGTVVWWWVAGSTGRVPTDVEAAKISSPVVTPTPIEPSTVQIPPAVVAAPAVPSAPALAPMPVVLPDPKRTPPKEKAPSKAAPKAVVEAKEPGSSEAPGSTPRRPPPAPSDTVGLKSLQQLPEGLRRELPPLLVSGSMYSPQPASRMLVLDGQVVREGDQPRAGLVIESIGLKSATLSYRGERFQLSY